MNMDINHFRFLLGSKSPRRQHLLRELGIEYEIVNADVDESYPVHYRGADIARYLCRLKADAFDLSGYPPNTILITADTIVWLNGECIGKPRGREDAIEMLRKISGHTHTVYSGICLRSGSREHVFHAETTVTFKPLTDEEIINYVNHHRPYDKAGSYGIQDWIGYIGITGIKGCYYNVMGFPVQKFWEELQLFTAGLNS
ncbi:MAG TPA: Maf family nucleotide pyrophosphatase [Bacteroidales bacterium]|nr:Maf family nucleotide pyrophosphatase [Bacteroidales bacterium]HPT02823.1 Maf family nucleotide pyrophosphatase [Bacteroidales bacterium]